MSRPDQKRVLITGVSRGIGLATAAAFRAAGWRTIGVDVQAIEDPDAVDEFISADLAHESAIEEVVSSIEAGGDTLAALVNNAAVQVCKPFGDTTLADWDRVMSVNLRAPFWLIHEALPLLSRAGGAVVNVSSVHALATSQQIVAYATSKGALSAMTRALALDLAGHGVRVNAVLPGAVDTPMLRAGFSRGHVSDGDADAQLAEFGANHVMGRVARPAEIAQAILYLADSERSSYVTGSSLVVDGGVTVRLSTE